MLLEVELLDVELPEIEEPPELLQVLELPELEDPPEFVKPEEAAELLDRLDSPELPESDDVGEPVEREEPLASAVDPASILEKPPCELPLFEPVGATPPDEQASRGLPSAAIVRTPAPEGR